MKKHFSKYHYAWTILAALCLIRSISAAGINQTGGLFLRPVANDLNVGIGNLSIYLSISSIASMLFLPLGGKLIQAFHAKLIIIIGIILQAGSFLLFGFMNSVWAWYVLSIPLGIGGSIIVNLIGPILINRWFHKNTGKALGIMMAAAGLLGALIQPLASISIEQFGWRMTYIAGGIIIIFIVMIITLLYIKNDPADLQMEPYGSFHVDIIHPSATHHGISFYAAKRSITFYSLLIFMIAITAFGVFNQHLATFASTLGYNGKQIGFILSIGMIGSALGAILIGIISDRIKAYHTAIMVCIVIFISIVCLFQAEQSFYIFAVGAFCLGLSAMGIPVLAPLLTKTFFGEREYELIFSFIMMGPPFASIFLLPLYGFIYDTTGSYLLVLYIIIAITIIGLIALVTANRKQAIK